MFKKFQLKCESKFSLESVAGLEFGKAVRGNRMIKRLNFPVAGVVAVEVILKVIG